MIHYAFSYRQSEKSCQHEPTFGIVPKVPFPLIFLVPRLTLIAWCRKFIQRKVTQKSWKRREFIGRLYRGWICIWSRYFKAEGEIWKRQIFPSLWASHLIGLQQRNWNDAASCWLSCICSYHHCENWAVSWILPITMLFLFPSPVWWSWPEHKHLTSTKRHLHSFFHAQKIAESAESETEHSVIFF